MEAVDRNCEEMRRKGTGESSDVSEEAKRMTMSQSVLHIADMSSGSSAAQRRENMCSGAPREELLYIFILGISLACIFL